MNDKQQEQESAEPTASPEESPVQAEQETVKPSEKSQGSLDRAIEFAKLRRSDMRIVGVICLVLFGWTAWRWGEMSLWKAGQIEVHRQEDREYSYVVDPNRASWIELMMLDGIGEVLAKRIVEEREQNGAYESVDSLLRVQGIGKKTLERFRQQLVIEE